MILLALMLAQTQPTPCPAGKTECKPWERQWSNDPVVKPNPFDRFDPQPHQLGPGPHTLIISDGSAITRMDYKTGPLCQRARNEVQRQVAPPPDTVGRIYGPARTKAFCVPR